MVTEKIFESALGISTPWYIAGMNFEPCQKKLKIRVDFEVGTHFAVPGQAGDHPVHDTVTKTYRHLNFFQHECELEVRVPRVKLPDGSVRQVTPPWAGKLSGFTLLFEAFVLLLCREMTFSGVARITGLSVHRVMAVCDRYVNTAVSAANFSEVRRLAIDETSRAKGHDYVSLFADADERKVLYVAEGMRRRQLRVLQRICELIRANLRRSNPSASICHRLSSQASKNTSPMRRSLSISST